MPKKGRIEGDFGKLNDFLESFKRQPTLQVGVLGGKEDRSDDPSNDNAFLASVHEYGSPKHNLPARSIIRTPIADHREEIMSSIKGQADQMLTRDGVIGMWKKVGIACEAVIKQAFATGGFGKWAPLKFETLRRKAKGSLKKRTQYAVNARAGLAGMAILIDTAQLRRAFSSRVRFKF